MPGFYGDAEKLAREVIAGERASAEGEIEEAYKEGLRLLEEKMRDVLRKSLDSLRDGYMVAEERVKSASARAEIAIKTHAAEEKDKYISRVMELVRERIKREKVGAPWYERYMRRVIEGLAGEAAEAGRLVVRVAEEDRDLARRLVAEVGGDLEVSEEPAGILGGAIASTPDGSVVLDYSLDLLLRDLQPLLRGVASRVLFGGVG
ncbi:MAG: V-type ATP synthase subunit E family protein [Desulfurococcales archaeon]|nr:V-type ATP synthase subunit E family protein [Desulfurococcales archaeon]